LVISDESHRSIGGNARAVFEYFVGYKLGLTATPKDYLKKFDADNPTTRDPRELERRILLDTYRTFGCESGQPTYRYSLLDGVKDGFLINPYVVDARTEITTQLLSDQGYSVLAVNEDEEDAKQSFFRKDFEKKFFSPATNRLFCETLLKKALKDPISREIGKTIVFAVSQLHATKLTQILNEIADMMYPGKYQSDFAVQVTSQIPDAQQFTINFANNNLMGSANFEDNYRTSKARICVTVGMMTTGYDCPDLLNLVLMRPVFSPQDFVQIKGRGTRKHNFLEQLFDPELAEEIKESEKKQYKLFDFFANCEYFEDEYDYDEVLQLPKVSGPSEDKSEGICAGPIPPATYNLAGYEHLGTDALKKVAEEQIGYEGMKIDRMFFEKFEETVKEDPVLKEQIDNEQWDRAIEYVHSHIFDKPEEFYSLDKLRKAAGVDRRLTLREILEKVFGLIPYFKSKDEMLEDEFQKFILGEKPMDAKNIMAMKYFFKAYSVDSDIRRIIEDKSFNELYVNPILSMSDYQDIPKAWRDRIPEYIKDYVSLNQFM
jgi:type I restriction enzyme R subunit